MFANLIDGQWVTGDAAPNINPSDSSEVFGDYARGTKEDALAAIAAAGAQRQRCDGCERSARVHGAPP